MLFNFVEWGLPHPSVGTPTPLRGDSHTPPWGQNVPTPLSHGEEAYLHDLPWSLTL